MTHQAALPCHLAPMEGVSSWPFRVWLWLASAPEAMSTPFLRATDTYPAHGMPEHFAPELGALRSYIPYQLVGQVMATDLEPLLRGAAGFLAKLAFVELNAGCPAPTCTGKGAGSALLKDAAEFHELVNSALGSMGPGRLAVKMRTGYASADEFPSLVAGLKSAPLARLTVHGRTRPQGYRGEANWELIEYAAREASSPVFASGDVTDRHSLQRLCRQAPSISGVLIGRGALYNPWIFAELRQAADVRIHLQTILYVLAVYALLHTASLGQGLSVAVQEGLLQRSCGTDIDAWRAVYFSLLDCLAARTRGLEDDVMPQLPQGRHVLGRVKMLWTYFRSSLPSEFSAPAVLRASTLEDLLLRIRTLATASGMGLLDEFSIVSRRSEAVSLVN